MTEEEEKLIEVDTNEEGLSKEEEQLQKLNEINEQFDAWEERLIEEDEEITKLEGQLDLKESLFQSIENNLKIIEDRQNRFDQLLSLYEKQSGSPMYSRFEILDKAKSLSRNLDNHQKKIEDMTINISTLKDMIYLVSDIHCKYSKIRENMPNLQYGEEEDENFEDQDD